MSFRNNNFEATPLSGVKQTQAEETRLSEGAEEVMPSKESRLKPRRNQTQKRSAKNTKKGDTNKKNAIQRNEKLKVIPLG